MKYPMRRPRLVSEAASPVRLPRLRLMRPKEFTVKATLLLVSTLALIPILLSKDRNAGIIYTWFLIAVHLLAPLFILWGMKKENWRAMYGNPRTFWIRILGIVLLVLVLYFAAKGVRDPTMDGLFWGSLFAIWALHTAALALLHIRGRATASSCPFA